jgi:hypothetical protein
MDRGGSAGVGSASMRPTWVGVAPVNGYELAVLEAGPLNATRPPTADELVRLGDLGIGIGQSERIAGINAIGARLLVPSGG